jgi:hypothetical protein
VTAFITGAVIIGLVWIGNAVRKRLNGPYPGGPVSTRQFSRTSAVSAPQVTVNVQTVDPAQLAAMASVLAAAARQGHAEIPVPSARALETEAARLAITSPHTEGRTSHDNLQRDHTVGHSLGHGAGRQ